MSRGIGLTAALVAPLFATRVASNDAWWHLATGRWILDRWTIPETDPFSFTMRGEPWRYVTWLGDIVLYLPHAAAGWPGVALTKVLLIGLTLWLIGRAAQRLGASTPAAVAALLLAGVLVQPRYSMYRPFIVAAPLVAGAMALVARGWAEDRPGLLRWLPLLALVGFPVHGSALLVVALAGVALVAAVIDRRSVRWPLLASSLSFAAMFATQTGRDVWAVLTAGRAAPVMQVTLEMQPPDFSDARTWIPVVFVLLGVVGGALHPRRDAPALGFALLGALLLLQMKRNLYPAVLLATPGFALALSAALTRVAPRVRIAALAAAVLAPAAAHGALAPGVAYDVRWGVGPEPSRFSEDVLERYRGLEPGWVLNDLELGGFLMWHRVAVFVDGRTNVLYDEPAFESLVLRPNRDAEGLRAAADQFDITWAIVSIPAPLHRGLMSVTRDWVPVYFGRAATIFGRRGRIAPELARYDLLREVDPHWNARWYAGIAATPPLRARFVEAFAAAAAESPESPVLLRIGEDLARTQPALLAEAARRAP